MAQGFNTMLHWNTMVVNDPYAITSVVYDPMALDINGDPHPQTNAQVSLQCIKDGTRIQLPITQASISLLQGPLLRALEKEIQLKAGVIEAKNALLAENREEIKELKAKLAMSQRTAEDWRKHSDKQVAEVKRLESVCHDHWYAKCDTERKWAETVAELDKTKAQVKSQGDYIAERTSLIWSHENLIRVTGQERDEALNKLREALYDVAELKDEIFDLKRGVGVPVTFEAIDHGKTKDQLRKAQEANKELQETRNTLKTQVSELGQELANARQQLGEVRVANGRLMDTKHELEKHARGLETIVASQGKQNALQASRIQALESQLNLLKHQYEGKCQAVRDLQTTGAAKERDEYSKALEQKETQISQITKQAGEWKQTATARAKEIDRLSALVLERTKERDALQAEKGLCPCRPSKKLDPWGKEFWADYPLPLYGPGFHYAGTASQTPATVSLNTRLTAVEARVEKLEEAEGFPMESYNAPKWQHTMLYMGNQWVAGFQGDSGRYYSVRKPEFSKEREWDLANQPTRWKPMPKAPQPDPMAGYYTLDKSAQVEEGDEYELSPGVWKASGNWQCCNKSQGKAHRYRRKIK